MPLKKSNRPGKESMHSSYEKDILKEKKKQKEPGLPEEMADFRAE